MGTVNKPDIVRQTIIINDDYVKKNRRADGKVGLVLGRADKDNKRVFVNDFVIDDKLSILTGAEIEDLKQRINRVDVGDVIAHESQHIHNGAIGYHYLANADNIYECMMLGLADEMSAMIAGYMHKTNDINKAMDLVEKNMSGIIRQGYIKGQFANNFKRLQNTWGNDKNLFEYKYDTKKIHKVLKWYFNINGQDVMQQMNDATRFKFAAIVQNFKNEIKNFIDNYQMKQRMGEYQKG